MQWLNSYGIPNPDDDDFYTHLTEEVYQLPDLSDAMNRRFCEELRKIDSSLRNSLLHQFREAGSFIDFVSADPDRYRLEDDLRIIRMIPSSDSYLDEFVLHVPEDTPFNSAEELRELDFVGYSPSYDEHLPLSGYSLSKGFCFRLRDRKSNAFINRIVGSSAYRAFISSSVVDSLLASASPFDDAFNDAPDSYPSVSSEDVFARYNSSVPDTLRNLRNYPEDFVYLKLHSLDGSTTFRRINLKPDIFVFRRLAATFGLLPEDLYRILGYSSISDTKSLIRAFNHYQYFLKGWYRDTEPVILDCCSLHFDSCNLQLVNTEPVFESQDEIFFNEVLEPVTDYLSHSLADDSISDDERVRLQKILDFYNKKYNIL